MTTTTSTESDKLGRDRKKWDDCEEKNARQLQSRLYARVI